jgi:preprotein translocase SecE subunit
MPEHHLEPKKEHKKNRLIAYFQDSYEELKKVTWPTRNQAIRLTFIVIGFCIVMSAILGALDFGFNQGYIQLVNYSEKVAPPAATDQSQTTNQVATGEPTSKVDLSKLKVTPVSTGTFTPGITATAVGSTQQK